MSESPAGGGPRSAELFERAQGVIPGGVSSPVRAFRSVGGTPVFVERGEGPYLIDADGRSEPPLYSVHMFCAHMVHDLADRGRAKQTRLI